MEIKEVQIKSSWLKTLEYENLKFSSAFDFRVTERDLQKSYRELNEKEDIKKDSIRKLKEQLERDKEFLYRKDDNYLLRYLRYTKFNSSKAYNIIRTLYCLRNKYPEAFGFPTNMEYLMNQSICTFLPYKDEKGRILFLTDYSKWNTNEITVNDILLLISAIFDVFVANPHCQISGIVAIFDFKGFTMSHLAKVSSPWFQRILFSILQECYPARIKSIYLFNCNAIMRMAYAAIRYLLKKKIVDRLKLLGSDPAVLHQYVNPAILPKELGGTLKESECRITGLIMDNLNYLKYERSFGLKKDLTLS